MGGKYMIFGIQVMVLILGGRLIGGSHLPEGYLKRVPRDLALSAESDTTTNLVTAINSEEHEEVTQNVVPSSEALSSTVAKALTPSISFSTPNSVALDPNGKRFIEISATCDGSQMKILGQFSSNFKGRIYATSYPDEEECGFKASSTDPNENVTFYLPLGQCGVQMALDQDPFEFEGPKRHEVTLYVQYSSFLQQVIDDKVSVSCVEVPKNGLHESMQILDFTSPTGNSRQGRRMMAAPSKKDTKPSSSSSKISSKIGESWIEILHGKDPSPKSRKLQPVAVGEDVTLVISTKVMRGYDARIVNCSANDGSRLGSIDGYRSQQILDSAGCSVDTSLVPNFRRRRLPIESRNRMITLHFATFPAFKFPERDHLHVRCSVAYCSGPCPSDPCDSGLNHFGSWREKYGRIAEALVDTTEIVNSIQVFAPELEDAGTEDADKHYANLVPVGGSASELSQSQHQTHGQGRTMRFSSDSSGSSLHGDDASSSSISKSSSVCVSPGSIIMALVILGVVLVISATTTLWFALKRSEARKYSQPTLPFQHPGAGSPGPQPYYRFSHW